MKALPLCKLTKVMVSEAGASVYSASKLASDEFPNLDVSLRGTVSIARRLQDPLAELVKIEPKSIGVGQYQHDVDQGALARSLDAAVEDCVNKVGVDVNMASAALLTHVSGLNKVLASNIVVYRDKNGPFKSRTALKKVPRLGPKAFEQGVGFLRINGGKHPLDGSAVHPEAYELVERIAKNQGPQHQEHDRRYGLFENCGAQKAMPMTGLAYQRSAIYYASWKSRDEIRAQASRPRNLRMV